MSEVLEQLDEGLDFDEVRRLGGWLQGKTIFIAVGPALLEQATADNVTPVGLVQDFNLVCERAINEKKVVDEETGEESVEYDVDSDSVKKTLTLKGVEYDGASLLQAIYRNVTSDAMLADMSSGLEVPPSPFDPLMDDGLSSSFFEGAIGIYIRIDDLLEVSDYKLNIPDGRKGIYLENCFVRATSLTAKADKRVLSGETIVHIGRIVGAPSELSKGDPS